MDSGAGTALELGTLQSDESGMLCCGDGTGHACVAVTDDLGDGCYLTHQTDQRSGATLTSGVATFLTDHCIGTVPHTHAHTELNTHGT